MAISLESYAGPVKPAASVPKLRDDRVILHFDYDCFYASVFEAENPELKSLPLAVQQKQIIVTCNYEARRRGLYKLQLIAEARKICPEVIIVLGEDLTRFRAVSKELYGFLSGFIWSGKSERLGFDEVFLDVTDMIDYNIALLNSNSLSNSYFHLDRQDPTIGFSYNATLPADHTFPLDSSSKQVDNFVSPTSSKSQESLDPVSLSIRLRLILGSHLANFVRHQVTLEKGYTATVGIAVNKLLSKLVGNLHKPDSQTTLLPPLSPQTEEENTEEGNTDKSQTIPNHTLNDLSPIQNAAITFLSSHDIGRIPGIGFKLSSLLRAHVLSRPASFHWGLVTNRPKETVTVADVLWTPGISPTVLESIFSGPGSPKGIGGRVWGWLHGVDPEEVQKGRAIPRQISLEDSYVRLDEIEQVKKELEKLSSSLMKRVFLDLTEPADGVDGQPRTTLGNPSELVDAKSFPDPDHAISDAIAPTRTSLSPQTIVWLAHPSTLRLSTRPRPPLNADGTRTRSFARISHSRPAPSFLFSSTTPQEETARKLAQDILLPMFKKLHPEKNGWNISLVNVAVTGMVESVYSHGLGTQERGLGRGDIGGMFRRLERVKTGGVGKGEGLGSGGEQHVPEKDDIVEPDGDHGTMVLDDDEEWDPMDTDKPGPVDTDTSPRGQAATHPAVESQEPQESGLISDMEPYYGSEDIITPSQRSYLGADSGWQSDGSSQPEAGGEACPICQACMPPFAFEAHLRYHEMETD